MSDILKESREPWEFEYHYDTYLGRDPPVARDGNGGSAHRLNINQHLMFAGKLRWEKGSSEWPVVGGRALGCHGCLTVFVGEALALHSLTFVDQCAVLLRNNAKNYSRVPVGSKNWQDALYDLGVALQGQPQCKASYMEIALEHLPEVERATTAKLIKGFDGLEQAIPELEDLFHQICQLWTFLIQLEDRIAVAVFSSQKVVATAH
ncbi:hypothetical protein BKA70DRAFT_1522425 [Coprinopsis sp. MPI-PUGE-AT-0042]|nr:hypothetical protein BKA70DRAFT_1522425 [Coprinopsis sp. MPI-PUGE-AT-0042]